jgi:translation initiation factor IF-2
MMEQIQAGEVTDVNLVLKADVHGTLEAIMQALDALSHPEVHVRVAGFGVGAINESDVSLASAAQAAIIGFNVGVEPGVQSFARDERVDVRAYALIHELIEHVRVLMERTLKPIYEEGILGHAEVRALFKISHTGVVAGCAITDGTMKRGEYIRVKRGSEIAYQGRLDSLRHVKNDVAEMDAGRECGVSLNTWNGFHEGDIIECYTIREIQRTLAGEYIRQ